MIKYYLTTGIRADEVPHIHGAGVSDVTISDIGYDDEMYATGTCVLHNVKIPFRNGAAHNRYIRMDIPVIWKSHEFDVTYIEVDDDMYSKVAMIAHEWYPGDVGTYWVGEEHRMEPEIDVSDLFPMDIIGVVKDNMGCILNQVYPKTDKVGKALKDKLGIDYPGKDNGR